jgi:dTDP-4-dehydrorhamnose 3,5-epimerase
MSTPLPLRSLAVQDSAISSVKLLTPLRHGDARGFFSEVYSRRSYRAAGIETEFVQDNYSRSRDRGVVRGLHFQIPPHAQHKLIWVTRGAIFDVAVDLRHGSPSYGRHVAAVLSADNWNQILIPVGFAHGFCTLEPDTDVVYKVSDYYSAAHDRGLAWDDPALGIEWPVEAGQAILSPRDRQHPGFAELPRFFERLPA